MTPSVRRIMGICRSEMLLTEKPLIMMRPAVGTSSPVSIFIKVDFPEPEGPTRNTNSPSSMVVLIPRMALVPFGYSISTSFRRIISTLLIYCSSGLTRRGSGRHNSVPDSIIYGFSGLCNNPAADSFQTFSGGIRRRTWKSGGTAFAVPPLLFPNSEYHPDIFRRAAYHVSRPQAFACSMALTR